MAYTLLEHGVAYTEATQQKEPKVPFSINTAAVVGNKSKAWFELNGVTINNNIAANFISGDAARDLNLQPTDCAPKKIRMPDGKSVKLRKEVTFQLLITRIVREVTAYVVDNIDSALFVLGEPGIEELQIKAKAVKNSDAIRITAQKDPDHPLRIMMIVPDSARAPSVITTFRSRREAELWGWKRSATKMERDQREVNQKKIAEWQVMETQYRAIDELRAILHGNRRDLPSALRDWMAG